MKVTVQIVKVLSGTGIEQSSLADGARTDLTGREVIRIVREDGVVEGYYNHFPNQLMRLSIEPLPCELLKVLGECQSGDADCLEQVMKG